MNPVIFHKVIENTDLATDEVVYRGDDPQLDVEGARQEGMQALWVNRTQAEWPAAIEPARYNIRSLMEWVEILAENA